MRNGKVALVTGSSSGIGAAIAKQLARDGYDIALHYNRSPEKAQAVLAEVQAAGVNAVLLHGDTADAETPRRLVRETVEKLGRLDVDVNNAGFTRFEKIRDLTVELMDQTYKTNYRGMILGASEAAKYMVENEVKGTIIFNTSIRGFAAHSDDGIYGGLKAGLIRTIQSFAIDLGRYGIRVNGFSPEELPGEERLRGLRLLTAPVGVSAEEIDADAFAAALERCRESFDWCLLDAPAGIGAGFRLACNAADEAIVVTGADAAAMRDGARAAQLLPEGLPAKVLVNRVSRPMYRRMQKTVDDVMDAVGLPLLGIVPEDSAVPLAAAHGLPLVLEQAKGASAACLRIARRLKGIRTPLGAR